VTHPDKLGKYQITSVLGEGAMGVVYRGFDPDIRRVVALKTIRKVQGEAGEAAASSAARFRNEAQAAGRLLHPGIVGVYDFGESVDAGGRVAYIAMEYVEGHTLSHYLNNKVRFSEADVTSIATQLLEALAHAHEHGVWHRDIKPSNVIMTKTGRVKIADFGIARTDTTGLTMANSVLGTPMYMAPEQFMGHSIDHRVDLYSTGVVLYQLLAGRAPFVGPHEVLMYKVVNEAPVSPSLLEGAPHGPRFDEVVGAALAKAPRQRFPNASAFRDALLAAWGQAAPPAVSREAVYALPMPNEYAPTERIVSSPATDTPPPPTHWDPAVLAQVEITLAKYLGPLAKVLVRRVAKECQDLPTLQAKLAEQITNASARDAFLAAATRTGGSSVGSSGSSGTGAASRAAPPSTFSPSTGGTYSGAPVNEALIEQAVKLLSTHMGPIAKVVVKRAAERTRQRDSFFNLLVEAAPEAVRPKLLKELHKLS
jgi:eukaryotic-like serine/threonine-protein kinase